MDSARRFIWESLSVSNSHGLKSARIAKTFRESSFLICLRRGGARNHWHSLYWNTNIASADLVTLDAEIASRDALLPLSDDIAVLLLLELEKRAG